MTTISIETYHIHDTNSQFKRCCPFSGLTKDFLGKIRGKEIACLTNHGIEMANSNPYLLSEPLSRKNINPYDSSECRVSTLRTGNGKVLFQNWSPEVNRRELVKVWRNEWKAWDEVRWVRSSVKRGIELALAWNEMGDLWLMSACSSSSFSFSSCW